MAIIEFPQSAGEKIDQAAETNFGNALRTKIQNLGLKAEFLAVVFDDGTALVTGTVHAHDDRDKIILALGNTLGVARVNDKLEIKAAAPGSQFTMYTVQKGDTLSKIAKEHLGEARRYPEIFEANKPMLKDPDKIFVGQVLRIPPKN